MRHSISLHVYECSAARECLGSPAVAKAMATTVDAGVPDGIFLLVPLGTAAPTQLPMSQGAV